MHGAVRVITIVAMLAGASPLVFAAGKAAPDLSGDWVAELTQKSLPNQDKVYQRFTIQQTGSTLTGNARAGTISGSVQGGAIEFKIASSPVSTWQGTVKAGEMSGKATLSYGDVEWHASRDVSSQPVTPTTHDFV